MGNSTSLEFRRFAVWPYVACAVCGTAAAYYISAVHPPQLQQTANEEDIPDEYKDPITYEVMSDPVVLCATGQVYDYQSLRTWLTAGNYRCPRTNLQLLDVQVTRLPWLRQTIFEWLKQHGHPLPADPHQALADIEGFQPEIATCIRAMRNESGQERLHATTLLAYKYRKWQDTTCGTDVEAQMQQAEVRACVMDDLIWMVRHGEPALQGAAASLLACCNLDEELAWLAATAIVPLLAMLNNHSSYAQEWALQVLYKICLHVHSSRPLLWQAGCAQALLQLLSKPRAEVGFHRDRAAITLATLAGLNSEVKAWLQEHGALPLATLLLTTNDRWEQRDAAYALMTLQLSTQQLQAAAAHVLAQHQTPLHSQQQQSLAADTAPSTTTADPGSMFDHPNSRTELSTAQTAEVESQQAATSSNSNAGRQGTECIATAALRSAAAAAPAAAGVVGSAEAAGPCAELLQQGLGSIHELLGRYRWCSELYLNGQADAPDTGLTEAELSARQSYEEALARYGEALAERQQQADLMHQPEPDPAQEAGRAVVQQQQQEQQAQHLQGQLGPLNQQLQQRQQPVHELPVAGAAPAPAVAAVQEQQQQQQVQGWRRRRTAGRQQQPRHWMAEHDADGAVENALDQGLAGGSSSSAGSDEESGDESSSAESDTSDISIGGVVPVAHRMGRH